MYRVSGYFSRGGRSMPHAWRRAKLYWAAEQRCQRRGAEYRGGSRALFNNTTGVDNTAFGKSALRFSTGTSTPPSV
jgi:hypothetical protein